MKAYLRAKDVEGGIRWYKRAKEESKVDILLYTTLFQLIIVDLEAHTFDKEVETSIIPKRQDMLRLWMREIANGKMSHDSISYSQLFRSLYVLRMYEELLDARYYYKLILTASKLYEGIEKRLLLSTFSLNQVLWAAIQRDEHVVVNKIFCKLCKNIKLSEWHHTALYSNVSDPDAIELPKFVLPSTTMLPIPDIFTINTYITYLDRTAGIAFLRYFRLGYFDYLKPNIHTYNSYLSKCLRGEGYVFW